MTRQPMPEPAAPPTSCAHGTPAPTATWSSSGTSSTASRSTARCSMRSPADAAWRPRRRRGLRAVRARHGVPRRARARSARHRPLAALRGAGAGRAARMPLRGDGPAEPSTPTPSAARSTGSCRTTRCTTSRRRGSPTRSPRGRRRSGPAGSCSSWRRRAPPTASIDDPLGSGIRVYWAEFTEAELVGAAQAAGFRIDDVVAREAYDEEIQTRRLFVSATRIAAAEGA